MKFTGGGWNMSENVSEFQAKAILRKFGVTTPTGMVLKELPANPGLKFPVVMKVSDPNILHKSDVGGVKVGIKGIAALRKEFRDMRKKFPDSEILIEEMAPPGVEFIAGILSDPVFGKVMMLGTGGIYTELFKDVVFRKLPLEKEDAMDMIQGIKSGVFCKGFRGQKIDCGMFAELLMNISRLATSGDYHIEAMDINPIIVSDRAAVAVDAKLSLNARLPQEVEK